MGWFPYRKPICQPTVHPLVPDPQLSYGCFGETNLGPFCLFSFLKIFIVMDTIILISISSLITLGVYFMFKISNKNRKNMINEIKDKVNE
jgi:hypothetical protein